MRTGCREKGGPSGTCVQDTPPKIAKSSIHGGHVFGTILGFCWKNNNRVPRSHIAIRPKKLSYREFSDICPLLTYIIVGTTCMGMETTK